MQLRSYFLVHYKISSWLGTMFSFQISIGNTEYICFDNDILCIDAKQAASPHVYLLWINHLPSFWKKHTEERLSCPTDFCIAPPQHLAAGYQAKPPKDSCLLVVMLKTMFYSKIRIVPSGLATQYAELQRTILLHKKISNSNIADAVL